METHGTSQQQGPGDSANSAPACDQCRLRKVRCNRASPRCSNCVKADVECIFTNRGKRVNHAKQLVEDFSGLASRLESIESSISLLRQQHQQHQLQAASPSTNGHSVDSPVSLRWNPSTDAVDDLARFSQWSLSMDDSDSVRRGSSSSSSMSNNLQPSWPLGQVQHKTTDGNAEYFYGGLDTASLFEHFRTTLRGSADTLDGVLDQVQLSDQDEDAASKLVHRAKGLDKNFPSSKGTPNAASNGPANGDDTLTCPPQALLDACMDVYLAEFNTVWPIFDPESLRSTVKRHYQQDRRPDEQDEAWNLCFTNIVLLVQGLQLRLTSANSPSGRHNVDCSLWRFFLANARRGFKRLDYLGQHWQVNLQALATLALVAAEFWERAAHQKLVHFACYLARSMGLHQTSRLTTNNQNPAKSRERIQLFWTIYSMDTQRALFSGQPCDIYLFDSDLSLLDAVAADPTFEGRPSRLHILAIMEEAYVQLYTPRAQRLSESSRHGKVASLVSELGNWAERNRQLLQRPNDGEDANTTLVRAEFIYYHQIADLLLRGYSGVATSPGLRRAAATRALRLICGLASRPIGPQAFVLVGRMLRYFPMLPVHAMLESVPQQDETQAKQDMELLNNVAQAVSLFLYPGGVDTYYKHIYDGMRWCIDMKPTLRAIQGLVRHLSSTHHIYADDHRRRDSTTKSKTGRGAHAAGQSLDTSGDEHRPGTADMWNMDFDLIDHSEFASQWGALPPGAAPLSVDDEFQLDGHGMLGHDFTVGDLATPAMDDFMDFAAAPMVGSDPMMHMGPSPPSSSNHINNTADVATTAMGLIMDHGMLDVDVNNQQALQHKQGNLFHSINSPTGDEQLYEHHMTQQQQQQQQHLNHNNRQQQRQQQRQGHHRHRSSAMPHAIDVDWQS